VGLRSDDSSEKAYPFARLVAGRLQPEMILDTVEIIKVALEKGGLVNLIINNRASGNAPWPAQEIARRFLEKTEPTRSPPSQLWETQPKPVRLF
jgi:hypothetical protein